MKFDAHTTKELAKQSIKSEQEANRKLKLSKAQRAIFDEVKKTVLENAKKGCFECSVMFLDGSAMYDGRKHNSGWTLNDRQIKNLDKVMSKLIGYGFNVELDSMGGTSDWLKCPRVNVSWEK